MSKMSQPADRRPTALAAAAALDRALSEAGVRYCHWKSNDHLAEALAGETDIDLFVAPADRRTFEVVMAAQSILQIKSQPWASYPGVEDWLVFDPASGGFLHLHVHYALLTGLKRVKHLRIPWEETLLANLRRDAASGWPIPTAEMEFVILLVRIWAKMPPQRRLFGARIPRQIIRELNWLRRDAEAPRLEALMRQLGIEPDIVTATVALRTAPDLTTVNVIPVARRLYHRLAAHRRMGWWSALGLAIIRNARMLVAQGGRLAHRPWRAGKTLPHGGAIIAVIGSDGSGKSTLTRDLLKWLRFKLDVYPVYMGSGDGGTSPFDWLRRTIKAGLKPIRRNAAHPAQKPGGKPEGRGFLSRLVELHQLPLMRHKVRLLRLSRRLTARGSLVVADRYPQDQVIGISDGPKLQEGRGFDWAARRERPMYDEAARLGPDLLIKLLVDPEIARQRKPDHDAATIQRKCEIIARLDFPSSQVVEVDANRPYEDVLLAAKRAIWHYLATR